MSFWMDDITRLVGREHLRLVRSMSYEEKGGTRNYHVVLNGPADPTSYKVVIQHCASDMTARVSVIRSGAALSGEYEGPLAALFSLRLTKYPCPVSSDPAVMRFAIPLMLLDMAREPVTSVRWRRVRRFLTRVLLWFRDA